MKPKAPAPLGKHLVELGEDRPEGFELLAHHHVRQSDQPMSLAPTLTITARSDLMPFTGIPDVLNIRPSNRGDEPCERDGEVLVEQQPHAHRSGRSRS